MRQIFRWLVDERATLVEISRRLTQAGNPPPKKSKDWDASLLRCLVVNPVYKGEYCAHRWQHVKQISKRTGRPVTRKVQRPSEEWVLVRVPSLVTAVDWHLAQEIMAENRTKSLRNAKRDYLLMSLLFCGDCQASMSGGGRYHHKETRAGLKHYESQYYRCVSQHRPKHIRAAKNLNCAMPQITSHTLDELVWRVVLDVLLDPVRLDEGIERYLARQDGDTTMEKVGDIEQKLTDLVDEDELLYQAYVAKAFDADEYAQKRHVVKQKRAALQAERGELYKRLSQQRQAGECKQAILVAAADLKSRAGQDVPFVLKRKIVAMVADKINVNTREEWLEIEGALRGKFDFIPAGRGS